MNFDREVVLIPRGSSSAIAFVGPSLAMTKVKIPRSIQVASPVKRADLARYSEYTIFVIIDGEFSQTLSVSPKEILKLIDAGKTVIGASSMGALRAAELDSFGMVGIGWVYRHFADTRVRREDDVALLYSPIDSRPLTVPTVNVKYWLEMLRDRALVSRTESRQMLGKISRVYFGYRDMKFIDSAACDTFGAERYQALLRETAGIPDVKRLDAIEALEFASNLAAPSTLSARQLEVEDHSLE